MLVYRRHRERLREIHCFPNSVRVDDGQLFQHLGLETTAPEMIDRHIRVGFCLTNWSAPSPTNRFLGGLLLAVGSLDLLGDSGLLLAKRAMANNDQLHSCVTHAFQSLAERSA